MANVLEIVEATRRESGDALVESQPASGTVASGLTSNEKWARWQEKGIRHDARVNRNLIRLAVAIVLAAAALWAVAGLL